MDPLWKIDDRIARIIEIEGTNVDPETGEIVDLDAIQMERKEKIENIIKAIQSLKADAASFKAAADEIYKRANAKEKKMEWLKSYLAQHMETGEKFECAAGSVVWRKGKPSVVVECDPRTLPEDFIRVKIEPKKEELKKALQEGKVFSGVRLEEKTTIYIR